MALFGKKRAAGTTAAGHHAPATATHTPGARHHISGPLAAIFAAYFIFGLVELGLLADIDRYFKNKVPHWIEQRAAYATVAAAITVLSAILYFLLAKLFRGFRWHHVVALTVLNFLLWVIAAPLIEKAFSRTTGARCILAFGSTKCNELKAARAFAWILLALTLLSIPIAWFFSRRAARTHGAEPVAKEGHHHAPHDPATGAVHTGTHNTVPATATHSNAV